MSGDFAHIARCLDLQDQDVVEAVATRDATKALLAHLSTLSAPNTGVAKVLLLFARMATTACDWIEGGLAIDLVGDADVTVIETSTELGGGLRERLFAPPAFKAPLAEFVRAIDRVPHMVAPLVIRSKRARRIRLSVTEAIRRSTVAPPMVEIATNSLFMGVSAPLVPKDAEEIAPALPFPVIEVKGRAEKPGRRALRPSKPPAAPRQTDEAAPLGVVPILESKAPPDNAQLAQRAASEPPLGEIDSGWDD